MIILGGSGDDFMEGIGRPRMKMAAGSPLPNLLLRRLKRGKCTNINTMMAPTILKVRYLMSKCRPSVWNGAAFHTDLVLFSDITLCTEDAPDH